jgi:hypothetical protein
MKQRSQDASIGIGRRGEPVRGNDHNMQIDKETGLPVAIVPDGEKQDTMSETRKRDRLHIDPESRIPKPVQPDLA